jgi:REP element-mobilizing transposase RayT
MAQAVPVTAIFHERACQKECRPLASHVLVDHMYWCIEIPPKHAMASGIGYLKGKNASAIAQQCGGREHHGTGEHCGARG